MANGKIEKPTKKDNRLRFKNTNVKKSTPQKQSEPNGSRVIEHDEIISTTHHSEPKIPYTQHTHDFPSDRYIEWGPAINGYKFIAASANKPLFYKPRSSANYLIRSYDWSYMALPSYKSLNDEIEAKYRDGRDDECLMKNYDEYFKKWKDSIKTGNLIYPTNNLITKEEILRFFESSAQPLLKVVKLERIRWHPDRFINVIKDNYELKEQVTEVFQIINSIYEDINHAPV
ncbi:hypothetical protein WICMUC_002735 [Wickerhamomyces mucosus]|uniref:Uncharacterized protein n=1 Tax=Wickerhamomyces mucosus TaxID=1378264 RepID=A0A9P8PNR7_9ASCO|nr:hypothetical protein WICMUC_002735 [Wickerhamomyces mucosus]